MMNITEYQFSPYLDYFLGKISKSTTCIYLLFWYIRPNTNSKVLQQCTVKALLGLNYRMVNYCYLDKYIVVILTGV